MSGMITREKMWQEKYSFIKTATPPTTLICLRATPASTTAGGAISLKKQKRWVRSEPSLSIPNPLQDMDGTLLKTAGAESVSLFGAGTAVQENLSSAAG